MTQRGPKGDDNRPLWLDDLRTVEIAERLISDYLGEVNLGGERLALLEEIARRLLRWAEEARR